MTVFETIRQGVLVAAEFAALLAVTPALAAPPEDRVAAPPAAESAVRRLVVLHTLTTSFDLDSMRPIPALRLAQAVDPATDDVDDSGCGGADVSDDSDDDDEPSPHVALEIDEVLADISLQARAHDPS